MYDMESENTMKSYIRSAMALKTTDELVEIWQNNNHTEWSRDAFDVVKELLLERLETLPNQNNPIEDDHDTQKPADMLLAEYETKERLYLLLDMGLYFCIPFTAPVVIYVIVFLISWLNPQLPITVSGPVPWYFIVCTLSLVPIIILRRQVKSKFETAKLELTTIIAKGLEK